MNAFSLAAMPNGDIVAGGYLDDSFSNPRQIKRWNGSMWSDLGGGVNSYVNALCVQPNGDLIAGGNFSTANGLPANRIARWNGTSWSPLETGLTGVPGSAVYALASLPNGELAVGGEFIQAGSQISANFARWKCGPPCVVAADCKSDAAGANDDNACNCASCEDGFCVYTCARFGNVTCDGGQLVNLDDILCVLGGFANFSSCANADLAPCGGNGIINLDDILAVLGAFAGGNPCDCNPGGTAPVCGSANP